MSQVRLEIAEGPIFAADVIISNQEQVSICLVAHHLAIDLVSWRILKEDLEALLLDESYSLLQSLPFPLSLHRRCDALRNARTGSAQEPLPSWPKSNRLYWNM
jgi:hypothetical protein